MSTKKTVNRYIVNDPREVHFQNEVVKPLLRSILSSLEVEDTSGNRSGNGKGKEHNTKLYSGYIDYKGKEKSSVPDLVIVDKWNRFNLEKVKFYGVVEVKPPVGDYRIHDKKELNKGILAQLEANTGSKMNNKVILTDTLKWNSYEKRESSLKLVKTFNLCNESESHRQGIVWVGQDIFKRLKKFIEIFISNEN